jgi:hypothetical protein
VTGTADPVAVGAPASRRRWERLAPLFPAAPAGRISLGGGLLAATAVLAGTAVCLARQPGAGALDTVWAEDGAVFLADAVSKPAAGALATSYAGYFHLGPRLLAEVAAMAPAGAAAAVLAVGAALVTAAVAVLVYLASAAHLPSRTARVAAAAIVVVVPLAQQDVPNSIANLHWPALYALFWVLLWTPARPAGRVVSLLVTGLVAASDILVVALLPLAVVRLAARRDRHSAVLAGVFAAGMTLQLLGLVTGASSRDTDLNPVRAGVGYLLRAVPAALVGSAGLGPDHTSVRWLALAALAWSAVLAAVLLARRRQTGPPWMLVGAAALHSVVLYVLPVFLSGTATERYALAPGMLVVVAMLGLIPPGRGRAGAAGLAFVTLLAVVCTVNLRVPNARAEGPSWGEELARARAVCAAAGRAGDGERTDLSGVAASLPLPPQGAGWRAELPCRYLER